MRIAVVSDIHANLIALEAVIADLETQRPDLVVQGGDLVAGGAGAAAVIDRVRDLGWPSVYGNTDEMLWAPERLDAALPSPQFDRMKGVLATDVIPAIRAAIGDARLAWLQSLPAGWSSPDADLAVVHASPGDAWRSPAAGALDADLLRTYQPLGRRRVVFGHIHASFVRRIGEVTIANAGSVSLSYDGDPRAAYALIDADRVEIRRVAWDVEAEIARLVAAGDPYADYTAKVLRTGRPAPFP